LSLLFFKDITGLLWQVEWYTILLESGSRWLTGMPLASTDTAKKFL